MTQILQAMQEDFKVFLQALWMELNLPNPTRAQYAIADYLQHGPKRLQIQAFRGVGKAGSPEPSCCGHFSMTLRKK